MISEHYILSTGVYWNPDQYQHEAWVVNQRTGEKICIGLLRDDGTQVDTSKKLRRWFEREIWGNFLRRTK